MTRKERNDQHEATIRGLEDTAHLFRTCERVAEEEGDSTNAHDFGRKAKELEERACLARAYLNDLRNSGGSVE